MRTNKILIFNSLVVLLCICFLIRGIYLISNSSSIAIDIYENNYNRSLTSYLGTENVINHYILALTIKGAIISLISAIGLMLGYINLNKALFKSQNS